MYFSVVNVCYGGVNNELKRSASLKELVLRGVRLQRRVVRFAVQFAVVVGLADFVVFSKAVVPFGLLTKTHVIFRNVR